MDPAHDWTDAQIEDLTRRFRKVYGAAEREMRGTLEDFMGDFFKKDAEWADAVASGAETQAAHDVWRRAQTVRRDYLVGMVDRLATDATRANEKALDMVNDRIPRVYAENANYGAYQVESGLGFDTHSFDLYDESTVRRLMAATEHDQIIHEVIEVGPPRPKLQNVRKINFDEARDVQWNRQKFTAAVTQSILQGESIPHAAKRLTNVLNMGKSMATRAARTAMTSAENAGRVDSYKRAKAHGIDLEQEWMATLDERTRYSHRELDGQHVPVGGKFETEGHELEFPGDPKAHPSETYNCFVEGTLACSDTAIERSYRHKYSGELVTVKTASGIEFTCTPNHPILTPSGWVAAKRLHDGDHLCVARVGHDGVGRANPDVHHVQARMEAIHNLLALRSRKRVAGLDVNFHGDVPASDVEVVGEEGPLRLDAEASSGEGIAELALEPTDPAGLRPRPSSKGLGRVMASATRGLGRAGVESTLLGCQFAHPHIHGIGTVAPFDPSIAEHPSDHVTGVADTRGDCFLGLTTEIGVDHIVDVKVTHTRGTHVYNLQTSDGYYFVGSEDTDNVIIAHNCRCTLVAWLPGIEQEDPERWSRLPDDMTYEDWKDAKMARANLTNQRKEERHG